MMRSTVSEKIIQMKQVEPKIRPIPISLDRVLAFARLMSPYPTVATVTVTKYSASIHDSCCAAWKYAVAAISIVPKPRLSFAMSGSTGFRTRSSAMRTER